MTNTSILTLDSVSLALPDGRLLFSNLNETFDQRRTGLVGRNGVGKSLLGQILAGQREPSSGHCRRLGPVHLLDQQVIERSATLADLAQVGPVIAALERIEQGSIQPHDFDTVGERWDIREQLQRQLQGHGLGQLDWRQPARSLSGGQAMRVALIGAWLSVIEAWDRGLLVISHDRSLLAHMARIVELSSLGLQGYGGNYSIYAAQKANQTAQAQQHLARLKQAQLRQARELQRQREDLERHQARAGRQAKHANQAKILVDRQQERSQSTAGKQRRDHRDAPASVGG